MNDELRQWIQWIARTICSLIISVILIGLLAFVVKCMFLAAEYGWNLF